LDKTGRVAGLVGLIAARLDVPQEARARALRAAHLAKADQVTRVVYELPELEGIMGRHYALHSGEAAEVAEALREQYLPLPGQPELPQTTGGLLLAVADRADTLVGSFAIGLDPSGSQDPFGLRRLATGLLALCAGRGVTLPLDEIFEMALAAYGDIEGMANVPPAGGSGGSNGGGGSGNGSSNGTSTGAGDHEATLVTARLLEFCRIRLEGQMRDQGLAHDAVTAVLARGWTVIPHAWERARAVERLRQADYFDDVHIVFQRAHNLALKAPHDTAIRPDLFAAEAETGLYDALLAVAPDAGEHLAAGDHDAFFRAIARLRPAVDRFLDDVLVMAPEQEVQDNRLSLLRAVADLSGAVADLSKLVV
ncbi:MAG: glycine--tRNA ligase subunit beta, partial [Thermaerobacterales bacterium]